MTNPKLKAGSGCLSLILWAIPGLATKGDQNQTTLLLH